MTKPRFAIVCEDTWLETTRTGPVTRVCSRVVVAEHDTKEEADKHAHRLNRNNPHMSKSYVVREQ